MGGIEDHFFLITLMGTLKNNNNRAPDDGILHSWSVETNYTVVLTSGKKLILKPTKPFIDISMCKIKIKDERG